MSTRVIAKLKERQDTIEWWAFLMGTFISRLRDAIEKYDVQQAVWAMGCVERCRAMLLFKEHLEEAVWMGQSAKRGYSAPSVQGNLSPIARAFGCGNASARL